MPFTKGALPPHFAVYHDKCTTKIATASIAMLRINADDELAITLASWGVTLINNFRVVRVLIIYGFY